MCWQCDHPEATFEDYMRQVRGVITRTGWAVQGIERSGVHPPWAYTIGLTEAGLPEFVATGMTLVRAAKLLNEVAGHAMHADAPEPGRRMQLRTGPLVEFVEVTEPSAHLLYAAHLYGTEFRALQVVHADYRGHWPWQPGYRGGGGGQPVLGARAAGDGRSSAA